ncbi:MAG: hypothetical protein WA517_08240 [Candidatus Acidiferrum sp.]
MTKNKSEEYSDEDLWVSTQMRRLVGPGYQFLDELRFCYAD